MTVMLSLLTRHLYLSRWQGPELIDIEQAPPLDYRFVIDINSADWPEFTVLPGISETYARRIVDVRNANGPFATIDALLSVPGIGPKRLDAIREFLIVGAGHDVVIQGSDVSSPVPGG
jgi:competence ComEA-like helix-hairpin-helix protein